MPKGLRSGSHYPFTSFTITTLPSLPVPLPLILSRPLASKNKMAIILEVRTLGHILLTASLGDGTDPVDAGKGNMGKGENWKGAKEGECNDPD